ncbi:MAG: hypothetical protein GEU26_04875 [Nitrososphaeraceae archaeon]|nr:hypothetical protein [Nitrososphaeraceae archaeon]
MPTRRRKRQIVTVGKAVINPGFSKLISTHRTAMEEGNGSLNKVATLDDIVFNAVRRELQFWH